MKPYLAILMLAGLASSTFAREWTDTRGRSVEAEVVKVNADRTVVLKTNRGETFTVPFETFVEDDVRHLDHLLSRKGRGKLHAVPWNELNELFGLEIWQDDLLWDDPTAAAAERMKMKKESKTDFMENHRAYPLGEEKILGEQVYSTALYGGTEHAESLSLVFLNRGDTLKLNGRRRIPTAEQIEECGMRIHHAVVALLGEPMRDSLGKGDLREKVWRWDWNGHAIMLSLQEAKYTALRIMPTDRADRAGRMSKLTDDELKQRMASCVERRENGDVVIRNIPMIDQGPKGYCSPATWERYLRYMNIPADMYLLALAANTGAGGGTYAHEMIDATKNIICSNGRKLSKAGTEPSMKNVAKHIDKGLPIMWRLISTPHFRRAVKDNTAKRNGEETESEDSKESTGSGGHICLIIGYNKQTGEVAISDSWGPKFSERWVPAHEAQRVSNGSMNVIKW